MDKIAKIQEALMIVFRGVGGLLRNQGNGTLTKTLKRNRVKLPQQFPIRLFDFMTHKSSFCLA
jgi:hypothetical protein